MKTLLAAVALLWAAAMPALADQPVLTEQQRADEINKLPWATGGSVRLAASKSSITLPGGFMMISGADAQRFQLLTNATEDPQAEAVVVNGKNSDVVVFEYFDEGYVTTDDWGDVDASQMLKDISDNTEQANAKRRQQNMEELHVAGWLQQPTFDRASNVVYWALQAHSSTADFVNAIALKLGRNGYEKLIWVTTLQQYGSGGGDLKTMLQAHAFDPGARYTDHLQGDKLAGYGIASLVAAVAGVKLAKAAGIGALLLLAKKFLVVILAGIVGVFAWIKRRFSRKPRA